MKVYVDADEMYPYFDIRTERPTPYWGDEADLPEDLVRRYVAAENAFDAVREEVESALRSH